jgi:hypothetical protein
MARKAVEEVDSENWQTIVGQLREQVKKKTSLLTVARRRLVKSRHDVRRLKAIIRYQRERILELYPAASDR